MKREHLRVGVVGGGLLGTSTAAHLARAGATVTLVTEGDLCDGSSGRSLSWLNSFYPCPDAYHRLRVLGMQRYRDYLRRPGASTYLRFPGGLQWYSAGNADGLQRAFEHMRSSGYPAEWLTPGEVRSRVPGLVAGVLPATGAVFAPGEAWVEIPPLVDALAADAIAAGAEVVTNAGPAQIRLTGSRVTSVAAADGTEIEVDAAVLATGTAVPSTLAELGTTLPDASGRCLLVRTEPVAHPLTVVVNSPDVSVRRDPDGAFVMDSGASAAALTEADDGRLTAPREVVGQLVQRARTLLAGAPRLVVREVRPGRKPIPGGDGRSVVGPIPGIDGYHVVFTHSGATLGLLLGELLAGEVVSGTPNALLDDFRPSRFS